MRAQSIGSGYRHLYDRYRRHDMKQQYAFDCWINIHIVLSLLQRQWKILSQAVIVSTKLNKELYLLCLHSDIIHLYDKTVGPTMSFVLSFEGSQHTATVKLKRRIYNTQHYRYGVMTWSKKRFYNNFDIADTALWKPLSAKCNFYAQTIIVI
jgi:hypothetical protein